MTVFSSSVLVSTLVSLLLLFLSGVQHTRAICSVCCIVLIGHTFKLFVFVHNYFYLCLCLKNNFSE